MSKIQTELAEVTGLASKRGENRQDYIKRLIVAVAALEDPAWNELSKAAQDWFNDAADANNAKAKVLPDFPDAEAAAPAPATSRRRAAEPEPEPEPQQADPQVGDQVTVTSKRGKVVTGEVIEIDDKIIVVAEGKDEIEINLDGATIELHGDGGGGEGGEGAYEPAVGDQVAVTNSRGKTTSGKIIEITDELLVIDDGKGEVEFVKDRIQTIAPEKAAEEAAPTGRRRAASTPAPAPAPEAEGKRTRASNKGGVSVGARIREIIAENLDITEEAVGTKLVAEGLEFRPPTLNMIFKDTSFFVAQLRANKKLK